MKTLTVAELVELLKQVKQDLEVLIEPDFYGVEGVRVDYDHGWLVLEIEQ